MQSALESTRNSLLEVLIVIIYAIKVSLYSILKNNIFVQGETVDGAIDDTRWLQWMWIFLFGQKIFGSSKNSFILIFKS